MPAMAWLTLAVMVSIVMPVVCERSTKSGAALGDGDWLADAPMEDESSLEARRFGMEASAGDAGSRNRGSASNRPGSNTRRKRRKSWLNMMGIGGTDKDGKPRPCVACAPDPNCQLLALTLAAPCATSGLRYQN